MSLAWLHPGARGEGSCGVMAYFVRGAASTNGFIFVWAIIKM